MLEFTLEPYSPLSRTGRERRGTSNQVTMSRSLSSPLRSPSGADGKARRIPSVCLRDHLLVIVGHPTWHCNMRSVQGEKPCYTPHRGSPVVGVDIYRAWRRSRCCVVSWATELQSECERCHDGSRNTPRHLCPPRPRPSDAARCTLTHCQCFFLFGRTPWPHLYPPPLRYLARPGPRPDVRVVLTAIMSP